MAEHKSDSEEVVDAEEDAREPIAITKSKGTIANTGQLFRTHQNG